MEFCLNARELDVLEYVIVNAPVSLRRVEDYVMEKYGVKLRTAARIVENLKSKGFVMYRRSKRRIIVDVSPEFIAFISKYYSLIMNSLSRDRLRYFEKKQR